MIGVGFRGSRIPDGVSVTSTRSRGGSVNGAGEPMESVGETSEQFVIVRDESVGDGDGMGDETLIEPFPFDAASVSTHHSQVGAFFCFLF